MIKSKQGSDQLIQSIIALFKAERSIAQYNTQEQDSLLRVLRNTNLSASFAFLNQHNQNNQYLDKHLISAATFYLAQERQVLTLASNLKQLLDSQSIPFIFLKGAAYSLGRTPNARGRLFSDVDILVKPDDLERLEVVLKNNGWIGKTLDDYDNKYYREWTHELPPFFSPSLGASLDVHHTLIPPISGRLIDLEDLWNNSYKTPDGFYIPSIEHMVFHSAIHLLLNDDISNGFRDLFDLYRLVSSLDNNQQTRLKEIFFHSGFQSEYYLLCNILTRLFGLAFDNKKHSLLTRYLGFLFTRALRPSHPLTQRPFDDLAATLIYTRGHIKKMPLTLLLKHLIYKSYRNATKALFGEFFFKKKA